MFTAANISSRIKLKRTCRVAGATVGLILLAVYVLHTQPSVAASKVYAPATFRPLGSVFVLLVIIMTVGSEWAADRIFEGDQFPIAEKVFGLLPWLYSLVLAFAVVAFAFWIKDGFSRGRENAFILAFFFSGFVPTSSACCV